MLVIPNRSFFSTTLIQCRICVHSLKHSRPNGKGIPSHPRLQLYLFDSLMMKYFKNNRQGRAPNDIFSKLLLTLEELNPALMTSHFWATISSSSGPLKLDDFQSPEDLLSFIKLEISRRHTGLNRSQYAALFRCYSAEKEYPNLTKQEFLTTMLSVFDDLFFGSTISARTTLVFPDTAAFRRGAYGVLTMKNDNDGVIEIYSLHNPLKRHTQNLWRYAGTLLHEMVHAFIFYHLSDDRFDTDALAMHGCSGHGFLWHDIAYEVETAFVTMTKADIDIGRQLALLKELRCWPKNNWRHVEPEIERRWNLRPESMWDRIIRKGEQEIRARRKKREG